MVMSLTAVLCLAPAKSATSPADRTLEASLYNFFLRRQPC
jgi:hypothetical protein